MPAAPTIAEYAFYYFITGCAVAVLLLAAWYIGRRRFIRHEKLKIIKAELDADEDRWGPPKSGWGNESTED